MPRRVPLCLVVSVLAAGCYDLPDIEPDVCGNKVIDGKEDCDSFTEYGEGTICGASDLEDESKQCVYLCEAGAVCPAGWGCGLDGVCTRPEGTFVDAPLSPWHMPVDEFAIGDVDGDGNADLIGNDPAQIMVRFGSANAEFPDELATSIRRPTGAVTYTHFDNDDRLDAIVPIDLGLFVLRGGATRSLDSIAYSPFSSDGQIVEFHNIEHPAFAGPTVLIVDIVNNAMQFLNQDVDEDAGEVLVEPPDSEAGGLLLPPPVADVNGAPVRPEFALTYYNDQAVHIYSTTGTPGSPETPATLAPELFQTVTLPGNWRVHQGVMFAQVDGVNGPDLVISGVFYPDASDPFIGMLVAYNNGGATNSFNAPVRVEELEVFGIPELGMNLPLAASDFDGDGLGDFVTMFGLFIARGGNGAGSPPNRYDLVATGLPDLWSDAAIGDFNGDDRRDVAVSRFDAQNARVLSGIDLFLAAGDELFNPFHIQTEGGVPRYFPRSMTVGDFDGDLLSDVAFFQDSAIVELEGGRLLVAFGAADGRFADATPMGRFPAGAQMTPSTAALSPTSLDGIDDLFVTSVDPEIAATAGSSISVMFGDSSRRMVAPLILDPSLVEGGPPTNPQQPRRALIGDFNEDSIRDFLVLADNSLFGGENDLHRFVWYIPGVGGDGSVDPTEAKFTDMFGEDTVGDFNFGCSTWEVVDLEEGGEAVQTPDELIGLDDSAACAFRDDTGFNPDPEIMVVKIEPSSAEPMKMSKVLFSGDLSFPSQLAAADFDDDGDLDPVVLFHGSFVVGDDPAGEGDYSVAGAGVGIIWNDGAKVGGDDGEVGDGEYAAIPLPEGIQPLKVAALAINEDAHKDLLLLTDYGVFMALRDPAAERAFQPAVLIADLYEGRLLGAGDVNGDGLTDFAVVHGQNVTVKLAVKAPRKGEDPRSGSEGTVEPPGGVGE
jgi:hypothetical protein